jgi:hypothetical protein
MRDPLLNLICPHVKRTYYLAEAGVLAVQEPACIAQKDHH